MTQMTQDAVVVTVQVEAPQQRAFDVFTSRFTLNSVVAAHAPRGMRGYSTDPSTWSTSAVNTPPCAVPNGFNSSARISSSAIITPGPTSTVVMPRYAGSPVMPVLPPSTAAAIFSS